MKLLVHREAVPWTPSDEDLEVLQSFYKEKLPLAKAWLWPRRMADQVLGRRSRPYAFRAFTRGGDSHVFVDPSETRQSVTFLLGHELCHQLVAKSPTLQEAFADARPPGLARAGDLFHQRDPEERFCDGISERLLGYRFDRDWWRQRVGQR